MESKKITSSYKISPKVRQKFKLQCVKDNLDMSTVIEKLMKDYIEKKENEQ